MICRSNQLTGFYMMGILVVKGLIQILVVLVKSLKSNSHNETNSRVFNAKSNQMVIFKNWRVILSSELDYTESQLFYYNQNCGSNVSRLQNLSWKKLGIKCDSWFLLATFKSGGLYNQITPMSL